MVDERQFPDGYKAIRQRLHEAMEDLDDLSTRFAPDLLPPRDEIEAENFRLKDTIKGIQDLILNKMVDGLRQLEERNRALQDANDKLNLQIKALQDLLAPATSRPEAAPSPFAKAYLEDKARAERNVMPAAAALNGYLPEPTEPPATTDEEEREISKALASLEDRGPPATSAG